jgi:hypothetical protein
MATVAGMNVDFLQMYGIALDCFDVRESDGVVVSQGNPETSMFLCVREHVGARRFDQR